MPETRSRAGRSGSQQKTDGETESSSQEQSSATETTTSSSNTENTTTDTTEGTTATTATPASQEDSENPQPQTDKVTTRPDDTDRRSKKSKANRIRLAKAKEELLRLQVKLAAARIATMEAEDDASDDSDRDDDTVISEHETLKRVNTWIGENQTQVLAISNEPYYKKSTEEPSRDAQDIIEDNYILIASTAQPSTVKPIVPTLQYAPAAPPPTQPPTTLTAGDATATTQAPQAGLSELAAAIARAARNPRYLTELPMYNGSHQEWLSFKAAYNEMASSFTEIENIARLRRCLRGRAKEAVENLLIHSSKPEEIMKTLESRFGRPDSIATTELDRLRTLPRLTDNPKDLCIFSSRVCNIIATLRALHRTYYLQNPEVTRAMIDKLTPVLKYRWFDYAAQNREGEEAELLKLARFLDREAERCGPYAAPEPMPTTNEYAKRNHKTFTAIEHNRNSRPCPICNKQGHLAVDCEKFLEADTDTRWEHAKNKHLCFKCLRYKSKTHNCRRCRCDVDGCQQWHNKLLHFVRRTAAETDNHEVVTSTWAPTKTRCFLKIIPIRVAGPKREVNTFALLDDGSTVTLIDSDLARQIGARGRSEPLHIEAIANTEVNAATSRRVALKLYGASHEHNIYARTIDNLQLSAQEITEEDMKGCKHLNDIRDSLMYSRVTPKILVGQDNWDLLVSTEVRRGHKHQPAASLTSLGWVLHGAHTRTLGRSIHYVHNITNATEEDMNEQIRQHFAIESLTITPKRPLNDPEQRALTILNEHTSQREDGRYETALLWKRDDIRLPNNYENALRRLKTTEKKIDRDSKLRAKYEEQMNALIEKGYAEHAPLQKTEHRTWYLPHFAVLNPMKPEKIRVVHDAAARTNNVSLNDHLLTGPDLLQSLPGIIMRFRQHPVAVSADVAEMFMQIKIRPKDRDALRYLWRNDKRGDHAPTEYRMTSLIFGATSSPATAIFIKNHNAKKYQISDPEAYTAIIKNHYVDDYIQSFENEEKAIAIARRVRDIHKEAYFTLKQWTSNSKRVLSALDDTPQQPKSIDLHKNDKAERILGIIWKPESDMLAFNFNLARLPPDALMNESPTKRDVLRIIMSLYDPLGFAAPITTRAKQIFQEIWRRGTGWDDDIDSDIALQWVEWKKQLHRLRDIKIPRCYLKYTDATSIELHTFVDASENAYAAVLYWRIITEGGYTTTSLIIAKARVAPLKITSIPRLELQAAVMGSRMAKTVIEEHDRKPERKFYWTDSKTVLTWLKNGARSYRPFVAHRIAAIEENSVLNEWRWIPTKHNVADDATRDVPQDLNRWYDGPPFLRREASEWPCESPMLYTTTGEERTHNITEKKIIINLTESVPHPDRFSKWEKLLRSTARVLQFIRLCKRKTEKIHYKRTKKNVESDPTWTSNKKTIAKSTTKRPLRCQKTQEKLITPIDVDLLFEAEKLLQRISQQQSFFTEIQDMRKGKSISTKSRLQALSTELIDDVIRLKTRIGTAEGISDTLKRPPILDGNNRITQLYIEYIHRQLHHSGVESTINECRSRYWILRLRTVTRTIISRCIPCRIRRAKPPEPPTGNHPQSGLAHHRRPFTFVGVDYFGPMTIKIGRTHHKRYVALFTCLTTRAIHLELAASLDKDSAIMALRRMIARRGCPTEIWSDNGTNLHGADRQLRQAVEKATIEEANKKMITWRFIPPSAPFMGGAWERLVRSVKTSLNTVLTNYEPTEEILSTLLAEIEYTINSRPLTHVRMEPESLEALTPNHFLLGTDTRTPTPGTFDENDLYGRAQWRASQQLADMFWSRWIREYLPDLQNRREPHGRGAALKTGDVVLIVDNTLPRNTWPRGIITQVYPGTDGIVRTADVKTKGGILRRPTKKLVILSTEPNTIKERKIRHRC